MGLCGLNKFIFQFFSLDYSTELATLNLPTNRGFPSFYTILKIHFRCGIFQGAKSGG